MSESKLPKRVLIIRHGEKPGDPIALSISCAARQMSISGITAPECTADVDKGLRPNRLRLKLVAAPDQRDKTAMEYEVAVPGGLP